MVSSNLVMSDRRVSRRVRRGTICGSVDLRIPLFNRLGIGCATRLMPEGAAFLGVHAQRHAPSPALTRGPGQNQKDDRERRLELLIRRLPRRLRDAAAGALTRSLRARETHGLERQTRAPRSIFRLLPQRST